MVWCRIVCEKKKWKDYLNQSLTINDIIMGILESPICLC